MTMGGFEKGRRRAKRDKVNFSLGADDWMVTYADAVTLLMAFFIIFNSISSIDEVKYQKMREGLAKSISKKEVSNPLPMMEVDLQEVLRTMNIQDRSGISTDSQGLKLELLSSSLFAPGSAQIKREAVPLLRKIAQTLASRRYENFQLEIQGHTDDSPINTPRYPSNWELSADRATGILRTLETGGVADERMKAIAFADTSPKVPNRDMNGVPIPQNQELNRRVVLRIKPR